MARVLVVDDDDDVQAVLGQYLAHDGHDVVAARSGDQALGALDDPPDVMLLDLTLPDLDGLEVLRRLRSRRMDLPVLVLSARGEEADRLLGLGLGADDYVVKPFSPREMCLRVAALLRRRASPLADRTSPAPYIFRWRSIEIRPTEHALLDWQRTGWRVYGGCGHRSGLHTIELGARRQAALLGACTAPSLVAPDTAGGRCRLVAHGAFQATSVTLRRTAAST